MGARPTGGGDTSAPQPFTITVTAVNDAPSFTASAPPPVDEDAGAQNIPNWTTFSPGPANESAQTVVGYTVSNVSNLLLFDTPPAVANNGTLTYTPAANTSGTATFDVVVQDDGGTANGGIDTSAVQSFTIAVNAINDAPVLTAGGTLAYTENDSATAIDPTITVIDIDSATLTGAMVQITGNYQNGADVLSFVDTATITGAFTAATGLLTLTGPDTVANYQTALGSVQYRNTSESPATADRTITWIATDGTTPSLAVTSTITVTAANDAPVLNASGAPSLPTIDQDAVDNPGILISALLATGAGGNPITDPDAGALEGIAVIAADNTNGDWQYDPAGGTAWVAFGSALADTNATLLAATASIRFVPNGTFNGVIDPGLTFRAWDQTSGANGATGVDVSVNGGTTAFSIATETASITIDPVPQDVTYDAVGNTELMVEGGADGTGAVGNAFTTAPDGVLATTTTLTVVAGTFATAAGGSVTIDAQGRFTYTPQAGDTGVADSFTYTVESGRMATVTINLAGRVWYVQNDVSGPGTGTSTDPFQALQDAETASAAGDTIFVFLGNGTTANQNAGIILKANQRLLGHQDTTFTVGPAVGTTTVETPSPGAQPQIGNTTGPGVTVPNSATGTVEIAGLDITGLDHGITVSAAGALTIEIRANTLTGGTGDGVNVVTSGAGAAVALSLHDNDLAATAGAGAGARLDGSAGGTLTITSFANNRVDGATTAGTGISITNAIFDSSTDVGFQEVNAGTLTIGSAADRVGAAGMLLTSVSGDLVFGVLDIFSTTTSLQATGTGAFTGAAGFRLTTASGTTLNAASGAGLDLSALSLTKTLQGSVTSTNSPGRGISLSNVDGTITLTSSTITNPSGIAFNLSGGTLDVTYGGTIIKNTAGLLVNVENHTTGTVTFNGPLTSTGIGGGIQLHNSDGMVRFQDTLTLNSINGRVSIRAGSDGPITFADATITYNGSITTDSSDLLVNVSGGYSGKLIFQGGTLSATAGNGIVLSNADGTVEFNGTTTLNGGNARVTIQNGSGGTFTFASATITNPSGPAFSVDGGTAAVTYTGSMTKSSAGSLISVTGGHTTGTLRFEGGTLSATNGEGIVLNNADGTVQFVSATTLHGGGARVAITDSAGTIAFTTATITNPTGVAFSVSGGSPTVTYNGTITDNSDLAVSVASTTGGGVTLQSGTVTSSAAGIALSDTAGAVTIADADLSGEATVSIANNTAAVTFNDLQINHSAGTANAVDISGGTGNVTITANTANGIRSTVNALLVNIINRAGGNVTFEGPLQGTGTSAGINISGTTGDNTVEFNGAVDLGLSGSRLTGGTALTVDNNGQAGAVVSFANLDVFTSGRVGINASDGGTLNVTTGQINTSSSGATGLQLNGLTVAMTFSSVTVHTVGNLEGLNFANVSGSFTVTGLTSIGADGSVGMGININGGAASYTFGPTTIGGGTAPNFLNRRNTGISIMNTSGTLQFGATTTAGAGGGTPGISVGNTTGGSVTFASTTINNAGGAGAGLALTNNVATITSNGGTIENSAGVEVDIDQGTGNITIANTVTNTAGRAVEVTGRTGGTVTLSGTISDTSGTGTGILVQNNTGGITTFSGASKVLNTGANTAVTLANNPGHTINFTNGGLDIDTTTATGFSTSGGGTINVTGTVNTIDSVSATALNVANTTIGSSNLNFQRISAGNNTAAADPANGIVLNNTGTAGGLTVTGTGTAGSGGTIQNTTGRGASFITAQNVTLTNMNFTNTATTDLVAVNSGLSTGNNLSDNAALHLQSVTGVTLNGLNINGSAEQGINGHNVNGFTLSNSTILNAGNGPDEDGLHFYNMVGTSAITNTTITSSGDDNVNIQNNTTPIAPPTSGGNLTITGGSFNTGVLGSGLLFGIRGTSNTTINISGVTIDNNFSGGIVADGFDTATLQLDVTDATITNNNDGIQVSANNGTSRFDIDNNEFTGTDFLAITLLKAAFSTTGILEGAIRNNDITVANGRTTDAISIFQAGAGALRVAATGNTIAYAGTQRVILLQGGQDGNGSMDATLTGNTLDIQLDGTGNAVAGILAQTAITGPGNITSLCADIGGSGALRNTFTHSLGGSMADGDIRVRQRNDGTVRLPGYGGTATDTAAVVTYLNGRNTVVSPSTATADSTGFAGGGACSQPIVP